VPCDGGEVLGGGAAGGMGGGAGQPAPLAYFLLLYSLNGLPLSCAPAWPRPTHLPRRALPLWLMAAMRM
jgi:hypothetical protein